MNTTPITTLNSLMSFKLEDGSFIHISREDCISIANKIAVEGALQAHLIVTDFLKNKSDLSIGLSEIKQIIKENSDMSNEQKSEYFTAMLQIIKKYNDL